ncbi:DinB family protein [Runella slithyformis]|uniref:DinB family protein n=1 Tax=Runella slithyformis (strain ATCC 29530 / DSM 19594 / LMG 11500 / NCIMB 11436 / LSU 4) TaxID=761193 RepID=A0A7U4E811_RUNSL|nr:DinB family protein [Runella slithyformis]AEI50759.1 hypothetical protein Runsl_4432 [Runella slithyformis DSM 19594]
MEALNGTIIQWRKELENYTFEQQCTKPSPTAWSLGQLYRHLIEDTYFYLEQATIAASTEEHRFEEASPAAKVLFLVNGFPDEQMEGAPNNAFIQQPDSKQQLMTDLLNLKDAVPNVGLMVLGSPHQG